jgi:hypothetical protein
MFFMSKYSNSVSRHPPGQTVSIFYLKPPNLMKQLSFKIPNEPIDKGENHLVTQSGQSDGKQFTVTLYFEEGGKSESN